MNDARKRNRLGNIELGSTNVKRPRNVANQKMKVILPMYLSESTILISDIISGSSDRSGNCMARIGIPFTYSIGCVSQKYNALVHVCFSSLHNTQCACVCCLGIYFISIAVNSINLSRLADSINLNFIRIHSRANGSLGLAECRMEFKKCNIYLCLLNLLYASRRKPGRFQGGRPFEDATFLYFCILYLGTEFSLTRERGTGC